MELEPLLLIQAFYSGQLMGDDDDDDGFLGEWKLLIIAPGSDIDVCCSDIDPWMLCPAGTNSMCVCVWRGCFLLSAV